MSPVFSENGVPVDLTLRASGLADGSPLGAPWSAWSAYPNLPSVRAYSRGGAVPHPPQPHVVGSIHVSCNGGAEGSICETRSAGLASRAAELRLTTYQRAGVQPTFMGGLGAESWRLGHYVGDTLTRLDPASQTWVSLGVGIDPATWYQYRVSLDFVAQTWKLARRTAVDGTFIGVAWTSIAAGLPFLGSPTSYSGSWVFLPGAAAIDLGEFQFKDGAIAEVVETDALPDPGPWAGTGAAARGWKGTAWV